MARESIVHLSGRTALTVSKEHEAELQDALSKSTRVVTLRDNTGGRKLVNTAHIVRVELRA